MLEVLRTHMGATVLEKSRQECDGRSRCNKLYTWSCIYAEWLFCNLLVQKKCYRLSTV